LHSGSLLPVPDGFSIAAWYSSRQDGNKEDEANCSGVAHDTGLMSPEQVIAVEG